MCKVICGLCCARWFKAPWVGLAQGSMGWYLYCCGPSLFPEESSRCTGAPSTELVGWLDVAVDVVIGGERGHLVGWIPSICRPVDITGVVAGIENEGKGPDCTGEGVGVVCCLRFVYFLGVYGFEARVYSAEDPRTASYSFCALEWLLA